MKLTSNSNYIPYVNIQHILYFPYDILKDILGEPREDFKINIQVSYKDLPALIKTFKKEFKSEEILKYNFKIGTFNRINIKQNTGISCSKCQIVIQNEEIKYFCFICNIFFCYECANRNIQEEGFSALVHKEHYLLAFTDTTNNKLLSHISRYKLGFNLFSFMDENDLQKNHNFGCDICGKCNNGLHRYICLNCDEGLMPSGGLTDVCELCFKYVYVDNGKLSENKEHKKNHVYLWMVFNGIDYYKY